MRAAPSCTVPLPDPGAERAVLAGLHGLAAAVATAWSGLLLAWAPASLGTAVLLSAALGGLLGARWGGRPLHRPAGSAAALHWSGRSWHLLPAASGEVSPASALSGLTVALDLGPWLLLRARRAGAADAWLVLRPSAAAPSGWVAMRVALVAHAGVAGGAADQPGLVG